MTDLEKAQKSIWKIYKEYCLECKKLETPYEVGFDEVNKLLDFIFNDIETVLIKNGKEINLSQIENEKALKRIEELVEIKVVENYKAGKYFEI